MDIKFNLFNKRPFFVNSLEILQDFYSPIISFKTVTLYIYFENLIKSNVKEIQLSKLEEDTKFDSKDIFFMRRTLESIGLISTYKINDEEFNIVLNGVSDPYSFFNSPMLNELLRTCVDKNKIVELKKKYLLDDKIDFNNDISAKFEDSFKLDSKDKVFKITGINDDIHSNFDINLLKKNIKERSQINVNYISDKEYENIKTLAVLFGYDEKTCAELTIDSFDYSMKIGEKINFDFMKSRMKSEINFNKVFTKKENKKIKINSETELANKINEYENISCRELLKRRQNGVEPVSADLNLIEDLRLNMGLNDSVINCLLDYVLTTKDGELPRALVKKIASTLVRKNIKNSLECYTYLYKKEAKPVENKGKIDQKQETKAIEEVKVQKEDDDEDIYNIFGD